MHVRQVISGNHRTWQPAEHCIVWVCHTEDDERHGCEDAHRDALGHADQKRAKERSHPRDEVPSRDPIEEARLGHIKETLDGHEDDRREDGLGHRSEGPGEQQEHEGHEERCEDPVHWRAVLAASRSDDGRPRERAGDGVRLKEGADDIGASEGEQLLTCGEMAPW
jgi:hypothetical protein